MPHHIRTLLLPLMSLCMLMTCATLRAADSTPIMGESTVSVEQMWKFVHAENADFPRELAEHYLEVGRIYGIRGDIALCQAILETGWFKFDKGTAVHPDQHNYCGLGVLKRGMKGHSFKTPRDGVTAQIQHLYAYASKAPLPSGEKRLDRRFELVARGSASTWEGLSGKWAANPRYATDILRLYNRMIAYSGDGMEAGPAPSPEEEILESLTQRVRHDVASSGGTEAETDADTTATAYDNTPLAPVYTKDEPDQKVSERRQNTRYEDPIYVTEPSKPSLVKRRRR